MERAAELAGLIARRVSRDGRTASPIQGVSLYRASRPTSIEAAVYEPALILVAQGRKQSYLAGKEYTYDAQRYLILSATLPVHSQVRLASPESPFLSLAVALEPAALGRLLLEMDERAEAPGPLQTGICASTAPDVLFDAAIRLVRAMEQPTDSRILGPLCIQEILYHVLNGPQGSFLRTIAHRQGPRHRITHVLNLIHTSYADALDVPSLAEAAGMSVSSFHNAFKEVTSHAPLQYVKAIRLHRARTLMVHEGAGVGEAAYHVGYASVSQFSREFRRFFGRPPSEELARLRAESEAYATEA
ncbi:MAG: AraC family transcriptional regulator [Rhodothermales bacterium]